MQTPRFSTRVNAGAGKAGGDKAGQIELRMARPAGGEEAGIIRIRPGELLNHLVADLVIALADHRADCNNEAAARGAQPLHGGDRRFQYPGKRAAPAGMGGADNARLRIGE